MKILEMLKEGRINAEEADRLIEKLEQLNADDDVVVEDEEHDESHFGGGIRAAVADALRTAAAAGRSARATIRTVRERMPSKRGRGLLITINTAKGDKVNVRIPLSLIKAGVKLTALLPESAAESMKEHGVNLDEFAKMSGDELLDALEELNIDIDTEDGDSIRVCCD
jgi:hypothetical protein